MKETMTETTVLRDSEIEEAIAAVRAELYPERCVTAMGRPVRMRRAFLNSVDLTMVEPGFFPLSTTGYRSVHTPHSFDTEVTTSKLYDFIEGGIEELAAERVVERESEMERFFRKAKKKAAERVDGWERGRMVRKIISMTLSRGWVENRIMTAKEEARNEIVEVALLLYRQINKLPRATEAMWKDEPPRWNMDAYNERVEDANEQLDAFEAAYASGGLFGSEADFSLVLQHASLTIRDAYGVDRRDESRYQSDVRREVRSEYGVVALQEEHLDLLAERLVDAGFTGS